MHGGAPGNCVLTARRIAAIYPSTSASSTSDIFRRFSFSLLFRSNRRRCIYIYIYIYSELSILSHRVRRRILNPLIFCKLGSIIGEASHLSGESPKLAARIDGRGHSRNVCNMAFNLRVDSLSGNANNRYWVPFNEPRPGESLPKHFCGVGTAQIGAYPRPRPRLARFPFASCDLRLDDSPQCRPTELFHRIYARTEVFRPPCFVVSTTEPRPSVFTRSSYYPRLETRRVWTGKEAIEWRESLVKNIEA